MVGCSTRCRFDRISRQRPVLSALGDYRPHKLRRSVIFIAIAVKKNAGSSVGAKFCLVCDGYDNMTLLTGLTPFFWTHHL